MSEGDDRRWRRRRRAPRVGSTGARFPRVVDDEQPATEEPSRAAADEAVPDGTSPEGVPRVGSTGARFARPSDEPTDEPAEGPPVPVAGIPAGPADAGPEEPDADGVGRTGARFNSRGRRDRRRAEQVAIEDAAAPPQPPPPRHPAEPEADDAPTLPLFVVTARTEGDAASTRTRVRPYVRTRGRTRTRVDLALETLVSIPSPRPPMDDTEHVAVAEVCDGPRSVAEVAALLSVPLGTARVLIDDMAAAGLLRVHPTAVIAGAPQLDIMQRVLDGLHRL